MFTINWAIQDSEWSKFVEEVGANSAGSTYDEEFSAHYRLFGPVDVSAGVTHLFGSQAPGVEVSLVDLAYQLSAFLSGWRAGDLAERKVEFLDDNLQIAFRPDEGTGMRITTNVEPSNALTADRDDLVRGSEAFLRAFATEVNRRTPKVLAWKSFGALRDYASDARE